MKGKELILLLTQGTPLEKIQAIQYVQELSPEGATKFIEKYQQYEGFCKSQQKNIMDYHSLTVAFNSAMNLTHEPVCPTYLKRSIA